MLTDINGMVSNISGEGSVVAARLAVEDFGPTVLNRPIEVIVGDHQNKRDLGASIARQWFDRDGVQMVIDLPNSSVALAVERVADDRKRIFISSTGLAADITGKACIPTGFQRATDTYALAHGIANAVVKAGRTDDGPTVAAKMKELPIEDFYTHGARVRADGRIVRDHYLFRIRSPAESKGPRDYYKLAATIPGAGPVRPAAENPCSLLHRQAGSDQVDVPKR